MSGWVSCSCKGLRRKRMKNWFVSRRKYNNSYFEYPKGFRHESDYSTVECRKCNMMIRSRGKFVNRLPDESSKDTMGVTKRMSFLKDKYRTV